MSWIIWCLIVYFISLWGAVKFCKQANGQVNNDDIPLILVPVFNTIVVGALTIVAIKDSKMWKCIGDAVVRGLNKL